MKKTFAHASLVLLAVAAAIVVFLSAGSNMESDSGGGGSALGQSKGEHPAELPKARAHHEAPGGPDERAGAMESASGENVPPPTSTTLLASLPSRSAPAPSAGKGRDGDPVRRDAEPAAQPREEDAAPNHRSVVEVLRDADMSNPLVREQVVAQIAEIEMREWEETVEKANRLGIPLRIVEPDGRVLELAGFDGDEPIYKTTFNENAAISAAVPPLRGAQLGLSGAGITVGVWDGGSVRSSHQEFSGGRVILRNPTSVISNHATHVAGTVAAAGLTADARGMAPSARVDSYNWFNPLSEMASAGAPTANAADQLPLANHSWGYAFPDRELWFGRYHSYARDWDALAASLPFFTKFLSAGNDQQREGTKNGYDSISSFKLAKNVIAIGAINDAVSSGSRSPAHGTMSSFSSWGPSDDGRIKPDLVANGVSLLSTGSQNNSDYYSTSGTSMASPSAAGAAALLTELYRREFSNRYMRSDMLKALLINTADDLGAPGPDYRYGWGLINAASAAEVIIAQKESPSNPKMVEGTILSAEQSFTSSFFWDGVSPIRATLAWIDPPGPEQEHDSRNPVLVHDLDLTITGPGGQVFQPFVMPFVGTWTVASMSEAATTGRNDRDNVEQVHIESPPAAGTYTATVTVTGELTRPQPFALVVTGGISVPSSSRVIELAGDLSFGPVEVGKSRTLPLTIRNLGNAPLVVEKIHVMPNPNPGAAYTAPFSGSIAPGTEVTVPVSFTPTGAGQWNGMLEVVSDATSGGDRVPVLGSGVSPVTVAPLLRGVAVTGLSGDKGSQRYFRISVPEGQQSLTFVMAGQGDADLYVRHGSLPSLGEWDFRPFLNGSNESVEVASPAAGDWYVMIHGYEPYSGVSLTADYTTPTAEERIIRLSGDLNFGNIPVGASVTQTLTIHNDGNAPLAVSGLELPTGFSGGFAGAVPAGGSRQVSVAFSPTEERVYSGDVEVASDKTSGTSAITAWGVGVIQQIALVNGTASGPHSGEDSQSYFFIDVPAGQSFLKISTSGGEGGARLFARRGSQVSPENFDHSSTEPGTAQLIEIPNPQPGRWFILLHSDPWMSGVFLTAEFGAAAAPSREIRLTGDLNFGSVRVNETTVRPLVIHNDGNTSLTVSNIAFPTGFSGSWSGSVAPGASRLVPVTFAPLASQGYGGNIVVQSDANAGSGTIPASGDGVSEGAVTELADGVPVGGLTGSAASQRLFRIVVPEGTNALAVSIYGGSGDADVYLRRGAPPTLLEWDYNPFVRGNNQTIHVSSPENGEWYVMLHGYANYSGVTLVATFLQDTRGLVDDGFAPPPVLSNDGEVYAVVAQSDGKVLIGGSFTSVDGVARGRLARLNPDGSLDVGFNPGANDRIKAIALQSDGKILIGGHFTSVSGVGRNRMARLNPDGSLDLSFAPSVGASSSMVESLAVQSDGKILIGGRFRSAAGVSRHAMARLNPDGSIDSAFNPSVTKDGPMDSRVYSLAVQNDGKILIAGDFTNVGTEARSCVARLNPDGSLDAAFDPNANGAVRTLALQSDGKIVIGGDFTSVGGVDRNRLARLNPNGSLDAGFHPDVSGIVYSLAVQGDGKIVIGGLFHNVEGLTRNHAARFNSDNSLDLSFDPDTDGRIFCVAVHGDGRILIGGWFSRVGDVPRNRFAMLSGDGTVDEAFAPVSVQSFVLNLLAAIPLPDGRVLIGGDFTSVGAVDRGNLALLNPNGSLDADFDPKANDRVNSIAVQNDGKILIGGRFTRVGGVVRNRIARLNPDGSLDSAFNPNAGSWVKSLEVQSDGKILVGGDLFSIAGAGRRGVARLHPDGSLDASFNPDVNGRVQCLVLQNDGRILIGGNFTSVGGVDRRNFARLNPDGSLDLHFDADVDGSAPDASDWVDSMAVQSDGKILIGGRFKRVSNVARNNMARLNPDGSLDLEFNPDVGGAVRSMALQTDGRILIGGWIWRVGGLARHWAARLNPDGSVDSDPAGLMVDDYRVHSMALQADGGILIGGGFTKVSGVARTGVARVSNDVEAMQSLEVSENARIDWHRSGSAPEVSQVAFELWNGSGWSPLGFAQRVTGGWRATGLNLPSAGKVRVLGRATGGQFSGSSYLIEQSAEYGSSGGLDEALGAPSLTMALGGAASWRQQTEVFRIGQNAGRSGAISHNQESWMETVVSGPGTFSFWWKVSSEENFDFLEFYINGELQSGRISGEVDWNRQVFELGAGTHRLRWRYVKDGSVSHGQDAGFVDEVVWTAWGVVQPSVRVGPSRARANRPSLSLSSKNARPVRGFATVANRGSVPGVIAVRASRGDRFFGVTYRSAAGNRTGLVISGRHLSRELTNTSIPEWIRADVRPNRRALTRPSGGRASIQRRNFQVVFRATVAGNQAQRDRARLRVRIR